MRRPRRYDDDSGGPARPKAPAAPPEPTAPSVPPAAPRRNYREESLRIHGLICAKCAREFSWRERHLLTVHHKDGNWKNNPPDGSNWENLCVYCHDDEHSRGM